MFTPAEQVLISRAAFLIIVMDTIFVIWALVALALIAAYSVNTEGESPVRMAWRWGLSLGLVVHIITRNLVTTPSELRQVFKDGHDRLDRVTTSRQ